MQLFIRQLGLRDYVTVWQAMQEFTKNRNQATLDEIWWVEHPPVYTQGIAGKAEHLLQANNIPVIQSNRGGQITYHGPGQLVMYVLLDLQRRKISLRELVSLLEDSVIAFLADYQIKANAERNAPGVYVAGQKIAAIGLRISRGCSYHGMSLNVAMDLTPFKYINPCGYPDLAVTQLSDLGITVPKDEIKQALQDCLMNKLNQIIATRKSIKFLP